MDNNWIKQGLIFNVDGDLDWNKSHCQVPIVDVISDDTLRIYYATRDEAGKSRTSFIEVDSENPKSIKYIHKEPILDLGASGTFDDSGIMPTSILTIDEKKYLYYIGWTTRETVPFSNAIGLAVSNDGGKTFKKVSEGPIIGICPTEPYFTGTCNVIKVGNGYLAYYLSCIGWKNITGKKEPFYDLKIAESQNAIDWNLLNKTAIPLGNNEGGVASASVLIENNKFKMWFSVRGESDYRENSKNTYRIGYAESSDGFNWERKENNVLPLSVAGWDSQMVAYPFVIENNNKLQMFYNGNGFGQSGFGYSTIYNLHKL